jgi:hypothetical protein
MLQVALFPSRLRYKTLSKIENDNVSHFNSVLFSSSLEGIESAAKTLSRQRQKF